jgi:DNA-directed RNA polymerase subunit M/transcription elongation factor TFIIS
LNWSVQSARRQGKDASWENPGFRNIYKTKLGWLLAELKRPNHVSVNLEVGADDRVHLQLGDGNQLAWRLKTKELDVRQLAKYTPDVLWPEGPWAAAMLTSRTKELAKEQAQSKTDEAYNGMFKCRKCHKNKVTYTQAQTRSADEPMVRFSIVFSPSSVSDSAFRQPSFVA